MSYLELDRFAGDWVDIIDDRTGEKIAMLRVVEIRGRRVRLGLKADSHIRFVRDDAKVRTAKSTGDGNGTQDNSSK